MMRFDRLSSPGRLRRITFLFDGEAVEAREGDTVATALLAAGAGATRTTPASGAARGAYCLMGVCFECLVEVDGVPNRQGCLVAVAEGMRVRRQHGAAAIAEEA
ncbi:MAG: (2Fe-2S)-binding protein [Thalassobaculum sp.]|uniref:(2Fe-2S)-binding protein n=1 Tax=Thalassobaculum sp. TaxID=2022740 RepID=UPI0032EE5F59